MTVIKPTIGRVVHVFNRSSRVYETAPEPALVTWVFADNLINVGGFNANGTPFGLTSLPLVQEGEEFPSGPYACWMPYQKGQAAKTEQLVEQLQRATETRTTGYVHAAGELTDVNVEQEIQRKGLTAPRITPFDIENAISGESYYVFPGTTLTVCALILRNGFTVTGESAAASPSNFDEELGRKIARQNAKQKIWALEGYRLRQALHEDEVRARGGAFDPDPAGNRA